MRYYLTPTLLFISIALGLLLGGMWFNANVSPPTKPACQAAGGVWVSGYPYNANECWSQDGTKRLFP